MGTAKGSVQRRRQPRNVTRKGLGEFLPTSVQKSYFMLSNGERELLNGALEKYQPSSSNLWWTGSSFSLPPFSLKRSKNRLPEE
jgi:hypothetical protein